MMLYDLNGEFVSPESLRPNEAVMLYERGELRAADYRRLPQPTAEAVIDRLLARVEARRDSRY
jgi:hypothetical protein